VTDTGELLVEAVHTTGDAEWTGGIPEEEPRYRLDNGLLIDVPGILAGILDSQSKADSNFSSISFSGFDILLPKPKKPPVVLATCLAWPIRSFLSAVF